MKVRFVKSPTAEYALGYFVGDIADLEEKQACTLIEAGIAVLTSKIETATEPQAEVATEPAPVKRAPKRKT